jgi:ribonucleotide reductase alpha subunit
MSELKVYSREEVLAETLKYFKGDDLAAEVWINKYSLKDSYGNVFEKSPDDMHRRIASELARIEKNYKNPISEDEIYDTIKDFKFIIPQGGPMSGIGNNLQIVSLSNCFVIGENPHDSYGSICMVDQQQIQLMKRRGGVGHDLSHIRPKGTPVKNSALTSTGVVPFMERYSNTTKEVAQDGRRGALMLSISINHPDAESFIDAKMTAGKVTNANVSVKIDNGFMKSVINNEDYYQTFPVKYDISTYTNRSEMKYDVLEEHIFYNEKGDSKTVYIKKVNAKKLWDKIIFNAWKSAEPGILFWDNIINESIPDCYQDLGYKTVSTNPCVAGETLIAVADGRNYVSIKQLAEEGNDVPVYAMDKNGKLVIKTMRNPRITGFNQQIYKITIEGGHSMRVTGNHKFRLKNGSYKEAKNLLYGDSLHIMTKWEASFDDIIPNSNSKSSDYMWINNGEFKNNISEHRFVYEQINNINIETGYVIHHKDYNSLNNNINNLLLMTSKDHNLLHTQNMLGEKNPYHSMSDEWKYNFASHKGSTNRSYIEISTDELKSHALKLTEKLQRRFSKRDWMSYAKENNIPQAFSQFRIEEVNSGITSMSKWAALELNLEFINEDPRLVKSYKKMLENGYNAKIENNIVYVEKFCEDCGEPFWIEHDRREISFCSHSCALNHINNDKNINIKRSNTINETYKNKAESTKLNQIKIFSDLKFNLDRKPYLKEWELECKNKNIPSRLNTKHGFKNFKEVEEVAVNYNHKVLSVELDGFENVYNGTVDDVHNFFSGGFQEKCSNNKPKYLNINQLQCGEIPLNPYDSCRLLVLNLYSYVEKPFTKEAYFNWDLFRKHVQMGQRYMDDIVDLEIEKIDQILEKIENDSESDRIKLVEKDLWENIRKMAVNGRRTGHGITAEGDMLAALGYIYGTREATEFSETIHREFMLESYRSSVNMAKERGAFPIYNWDREKENPFIERIYNLDSELYKEMVEYGRRNIALLTIAPTGTVSLMTQTTSGIEPCFLPVYMRRRKINTQEKNVRVDFVDEEGVAWQEYPVFHHKFETWLEVNDFDIDAVKNMKKEQLDEIVKQSPYYKATANDVDWVEKVEMQGRIQKYVDHSISVTVNLPSNATEEIVAKVYERGWSSGCKGITVYRDGSRSGVLISKKEQKEKEKLEAFKDNNAPKRPKRLKADIIRFQNDSEKWIAVVGLLDGRPYELFTGRLVNGMSSLSPTIKECEVVKNKIDGEDGKKTSRYDMEYIDVDGEKKIYFELNHSFNPEFWNYAKLVSGLLRHGMPLIYIYELINSLNLNDAHLNTWKAGVERVIKRYMKDGEKAKGVCQECGSEHLEFKEGCMTCMNCGSSKCS